MVTQDQRNAGDGARAAARPARDDDSAPGPTMSLASAAFGDRDVLPDRYAHDREDVSPELSWADVPSNAVELALVCHDPDAPRGAFVHWVVAGIDPSTIGVAEGTTPAGSVPGINGWGELGWGGPRPPAGDGPHRYVFTLYASGAPLGFVQGSTADDLLAELGGREVARGRLVGLYER